MVMSNSAHTTAGLLKHHDIITSECLDGKVWHGGVELKSSCILKCIYCTACDYMLEAILEPQAARPPEHLMVSLVPLECNSMDMQLWNQLQSYQTLYYCAGHALSWMQLQPFIHESRIQDGWNIAGHVLLIGDCQCI